mmetsp:Transcript_28465/g.25306  ORF Transcript_28465/g.25306 Transcript_28465/m.25306 type:complete len:107 (+) Transcript_28465:6639-6959(+)
MSSIQYLSLVSNPLFRYTQMFGGNDNNGGSDNEDIKIDDFQQEEAEPQQPKKNKSAFSAFLKKQEEQDKKKRELSGSDVDKIKDVLFEKQGSGGIAKKSQIRPSSQ